MFKNCMQYAVLSSAFSKGRQKVPTIINLEDFAFQMVGQMDYGSNVSSFKFCKYTLWRNSFLAT